MLASSLESSQFLKEPLNLFDMPPQQIVWDVYDYRVEPPPPFDATFTDSSTDSFELWVYGFEITESVKLAVKDRLRMSNDSPEDGQLSFIVAVMDHLSQPQGLAIPLEHLRADLSSDQRQGRKSTYDIIYFAVNTKDKGLRHWCPTRDKLGKVCAELDIEGMRWIQVW
ncbi:hypothetical protein C8J56DRAFT_426444 [Mycena floridula]|nr:hypothetical protein C8J56DRAFT_426444 [Mycena floridula]